MVLVDPTRANVDEEHYAALTTSNGIDEDGDKYTNPDVVGWRSHLLYAKIACWWCGYELSQTALATVIWPSQISAILNDKNKEDFYNGFIPSPGAIISLIVTPMAGIMSDYYRNSTIGRRKVFLISGTVVAIVLQMLMSLFSRDSGPSSVYLLMFVICIFQLGSQFAAGPFSGFVPDLVIKSRLGIASGWLGAALALGSIVGSLGAGVLVDDGFPTTYWPAYLYVSILFAALASVTFFGVHEIPRPREGKFTWRQVLTVFYIDLKVYRNFFWVVLTRTFFDMGVYSILPFLKFFFQDVLQSAKPSLMSSIVLGVLIIVSIPASLISGHLSDVFGRKMMVNVGSGIMAVGCGMFIILSIIPSLGGTFVVAAFLGLGYGTYVAVDWALAIDCLPPGANIAKDMGIWHLAVVVPQALAPLIAGAILTLMKENYGIAAAYATLFAVIVAWFILAIVFVFFVQLPKRGIQATHPGLPVELSVTHEKMDAAT